MNPDQPMPPSPKKPDLASRILSRIEGEHIAPRPRWQYTLRNAAFWVIATLAVILGALAVAALIFGLSNAGWTYYAATHPTLFDFAIDVIPYAWVVALIVLMAIGYWNIRRTRRGYRYPLPLVAAGVIVLSALLGGALFAAGLGQDIEEAIGDHPPFYRPTLALERSWWSDPQKGLVAGTVITVASDLSSFSMRTFSGQEIQVDADDLRSFDLTTLARGGTVRVVGVPSVGSSTVLHACFVFPWKVYGLFTNAAPVRPLIGFTSSTTERIPDGERSDECKGVRPYALLRALEEH